MTRPGAGLLIFVLGIFGASAAVVTRGPYLQQATPDSIVVRWRTDLGTRSFVRYGALYGDLSNTVSDATVATNHVVQITNLAPDTKYFYEIGTASSWFAAATNTFFVTSPIPGPARPTRIWVVGDSGSANANAAAVRDAFRAYGARKADLWLMLGDNAYNSGTDSEYQKAVFDMYPTILRNTPLWPTIGNHETPAIYVTMFTLPQAGEAGGVPSGTEHYYSFDYASIHFICLDSYASDVSSNAPMALWLKADLDATAQQWIIAYWHHPPYTHGTHNSDTDPLLTAVRRNIVPILEDYGVDLVLCGHSHVYERSFLLNGHYGASSTFAEAMKVNGGDGRQTGDGAYLKSDTGSADQGTVYTVAGSGGQLGGGSLDHPAMFIGLSVLGSVVIDVNGNRLDLTFVKTNAAVGDYFTMIKAPPATNAPAAPSVLVASAVSSSEINLSWLDNADNEQGFELERSTNSVDFVRFVRVGSDVTNAVDTGLGPAATYYYRVRAYNVADASPYSNIAQATTAPPIINAPTAPTNLVATLISSNQIRLSWIDKATNEQGFELERSTNNIDFISVTTVNANVTNTVDTGLAFGATFYYRVRAYNAGGPSSFSKTAQATTPQVPAAPTNLVATAISSSQIRLAWSDKATNEQGFELERSTNGVGFTRFTTVGANVTNTVDSSLAPATTYYYRARAYNVAGASPYSSSAQATTLAAPTGDTTPPAAVADLMVVATTTNNIVVAWTAPGDDGNIGTATGYDVRYATSPISEANWSSAKQATNEPPPAPAGNSQSVAISGLSLDLTYYFALKTSDETNNISLLSNIASGSTTTPTPLDAVLSASNSVWKYFDRGGDPGTAWRERIFDDSAWLSGRAKLGYGFGDEGTVVSYGGNASDKFITTWFRRSMNIPAPGRYTNLTVQLLRDDGAIIYVNGVEVYRSNMPEGAITSTTSAAADVTGSGSYRFYTRNVSPALLVGGTNVIAVELHQSSRTSTDLAFDLQLTAGDRCRSGGTEPSPVLAIARSGSNVIIGWPVTCATYALEQTDRPEVAASWASVNAPFTFARDQYNLSLPADQAARFYRLRKTSP